MIRAAYKILLVACHYTRPDLALDNAANEVQNIVNSKTLKIRLMQGSQSNEHDILNELRRPNGQPYDILLIAGHGNDKGVLLNDDELWTTNALVATARSNNLKLVFINSCSSVAIASQITKETSCDVICTIMDVPDREAYRTSSLFVQNLDSGLSPYASFIESEPGGDRHYVYLFGRKEMAHDSLAANVPDKYSTEIASVREWIARVEEDVRLIGVKIDIIWDFIHPDPRAVVSSILAFLVFFGFVYLWALVEIRSYLLLPQNRIIALALTGFAVLTTILLLILARIYGYPPKKSSND